jgi:hypothetical protein
MIFADKSGSIYGTPFEALTKSLLLMGDTLFPSDDNKPF